MGSDEVRSTVLRKWLLRATDGQYRLLCWVAGSAGLPSHVLYRGSTPVDTAQGIAIHLEERPERLARVVKIVREQLGEDGPDSSGGAAGEA